MSPISNINYSQVHDTKLKNIHFIVNLLVMSVIILSFILPVRALAAPAVSECLLALTITQPSPNTYTLTIKNTGQKICKNAHVSVYYPDHLSYVSSAPKPTTSDYHWKLGTINPNGKKTISLVTKVTNTPSDESTLEACAAAGNTIDACATPTPHPTLTTPPTPIIYPTTPIIPNSQEYGTWVWKSPLGMLDAYMNKVISGAIANKINVIYITIDDYLDIYHLPEGPTKQSKKIQYSDALEKFIIAAKKANIEVDVEAGWRDWAEAPNTYKGLVIIDYAIEYNKLRANKIRGVQFDVEPYLLPTYETNKAAVLKNFVAFVDSATKRLGANELDLQIVIPHFYDSTQQWTPSFSYGGLTAHAYTHILRILDTRPDSSITLMSYRNFALGNNGTVQISKAEIDQASVGTHSTKIIVAQETGNVDPAYVTFFNLTKMEYEKQISIIKNTFASSRNFGGIAVHYIDSFLVLR